ncbi:MAG: CBS domain-containing protein [Acidobacteriota bacterium]
MTAIPTARELMGAWYVTLRPEQDLEDAIRMLVARRASGAPVIDREGRLLGLLTEKDCLRVLANSAYGETGGGTVVQFMSSIKRTVDADMDLFSIAGVFLESNFPVLPVVEESRLVGRLDRQQMLGHMEAFMNEQDVETRRALHHHADDAPAAIESMQRAAAEFRSH